MRARKSDPPESAAASVLFGKTRRRLLAWLFLHPDEGFYVRQLVRIIGGSPGSVPTDLRLLTSAGLLLRSKERRKVYYQANRRSPIYEELRRIIEKTTHSTDRNRSLTP